MVKPWDTTTIGNFLEFKNGLNKGKDFFGYGTPIINYTDIYKKRGLKKIDVRGRVCLTPDEIHRFNVHKNDVFFTRTSETPDEVGMSSVLLEEIENCVFSGFVLRGRPKNDLFVPEYCKYCFSTESVRNAIIIGCTYTTRALTNGKQLAAIEIAVPPKTEQEAIAAALSDMDTLIENLERLIAKKKAIKQGVMQELLTGKRRLPGFDGRWIRTTLGELCYTASGGTPSRQNETYYTGNIPWITTSELTDGWIVDSNEHITSQAIENSATKVFTPNTILLAMYGATIGKVGILTKPSCSNQACCALICKHDDYLLLFYKLISIRPYLVSLGCGAGQPNISQEIIRGIDIDIPEDIEEQKAISLVMNDLDRDISLMEKKLQKYKGIKSGMMSELLTGRIRLIDKEDA